MLYLFHNIEEYSDEEYEADLKRVTAARRNKAMEFRFLPDRKRSIKAYMLLMKGLKEEYGIDEAPEFEYEEHGRPTIAGRPDIHFSMSHCATSVLCVIDSIPVGADIENDIKDMELMKMICCKEEQELILQSENAENAFAACWTAKESLAKLRGTGLVDIAETRALSSVSDEEHVLETFACPAEGYVYSVSRYLESAE